MVAPAQLVMENVKKPIQLPLILHHLCLNNLGREIQEAVQMPQDTGCWVTLTFGYGLVAVNLDC
jgi:hypothetical protein